jgi:hypothetical protein
VYLGIGGREFYLDTDRDDFEPGTSIDYVLGEDSNVHNAAQNDPRDQILYVEHAYQLPCYIRFKGKDRGDEWKLLRAGVSLNDSVVPVWDTASLFSFGQGGGIWMGTRATEMVVLPLEANVRHQVQAAQAAAAPVRG